jgi:acyl carrier protein
MDRATFIAALEDMLELNHGTLHEDRALADIEVWDSLAVISFIALVDEHFNQVIAGEALAKAKTVGDLVGLAGL